MTVVYTIAAVMLITGAVFILGLTPEVITDDIMKTVSKEQTLRDMVLIAQHKKKSRRISDMLRRINEALKTTGKESQFTIVCASSLALLVAGCVIPFLIGNVFILPILAVTLAGIPFIYAKKTLDLYDRHMKEELETTLSIITTSYIRTDDITSAVSENITYLRPPVKDLFQAFVAETTLITSDTKKALRTLRNKIENDVFTEWCDALIACQDDRTLKSTLLPIVSKLTDVRIVNNELKTMLGEVKKEYLMMVCMVIGNIPLIYALNKDWFDTLVFSTAGKITLAVCGTVILVTAVFMMRWTKPIEYKK